MIFHPLLCRGIRTALLVSLVLFFSQDILAQKSPPWERPLKICYSSDGITFGTAQIYQDSSGVPSSVKLPNGDLICAFQWFREPMGPPSWDRVAVKFSSDNGFSWTTPVEIEIPNLPTTYQRPFDPTLA